MDQLYYNNYGGISSHPLPIINKKSPTAPPTPPTPPSIWRKYRGRIITGICLSLLNIAVIYLPLSPESRFRSELLCISNAWLGACIYTLIPKRILEKWDFFGLPPSIQITALVICSLLFVAAMIAIFLVRALHVGFLMLAFLDMMALGTLFGNNGLLLWAHDLRVRELW